MENCPCMDSKTNRRNVSIPLLLEEEEQEEEEGRRCESTSYFIVSSRPTAGRHR